MSDYNSPSTDPTVTPAYRNILVPTDGSPGARLAMDHAIAISKAFDGTIHAMSVDEGSGSLHQDQLRNDPEDIATEATEEAARKGKANDVSVTTVVKSGTPEQAIVSYAEETDIDLIVMGTEGQTGLKNILFGSVAEETVRKSSVPVLAVQSPESDTADM